MPLVGRYLFFPGDAAFHSRVSLLCLLFRWEVGETTKRCATVKGRFAFLKNKGDRHWPRATKPTASGA